MSQLRVPTFSPNGACRLLAASVLWLALWSSADGWAAAIPPAPPAAAAEVSPTRVTVTRPVNAGESLSALLRTGVEAEFTFAILSQPLLGEVTLDDPATGAFTYTATIGVGGRDSFRYSMTAADGTTSLATAYVTVRRPGRAAVAAGTIDQPLDVASWPPVMAADTGMSHVAGLTAEGTVVATGGNSHGQTDVAALGGDIVALTAGDYHTVGLKRDGSVVVTGFQIGDAFSVYGWSDVAAVAAGDWDFLALHEDGTVSGVGLNESGELEVDAWRDVIQIDLGTRNGIALKADGSAVTSGDDTYGQRDVSGWSDLVAVAAGGYHNVGLKADGSVVAVGWNNSGQTDVSGWSEVVAVAAGYTFTLGLRADGSVLWTGSNSFGQGEVGAWQGISAIAASVGTSLGVLPRLAQTLEGLAADVVHGVVGNSANLTVTSHGDSGEPVVFAAVTPHACSVAGTRVTFLAAGTCTVRASQAGNGTYDPAPALLLDIPVENYFGIIVTADVPLLVDETGSSAQFTVELKSQPTSSVYIPLEVSDASEAAVTPGELWFSPSDWAQPRTVTVTGVDDSEADGDVDLLVRLLPAISEDPDYGGLDGGDVAVRNLDDELPNGCYGGSRTVTDMAFDVSADVRVEGDLATRGAVTIEAPADVLFEAGGRVTLGPGFRAAAGSRFVARTAAVVCGDSVTQEKADGKQGGVASASAVAVAVAAAPGRGTPAAATLSADEPASVPAPGVWALAWLGLGLAAAARRRLRRLPGARGKPFSQRAQG